jgi:hypothetical protein
MRRLARLVVPAVASLLILMAPGQLLAQDEAISTAEEAPLPSDTSTEPEVSTPEVDVPADVTMPTADQPQVPPEVLEQLTRELENILGPLDNLYCSIPSVGFLPATQC